MSKHDKFRKNPCTPTAAKKSAKSESDTPAAANPWKSVINLTTPSVEICVKTPPPPQKQSVRDKNPGAFTIMSQIMRTFATYP